MLVMPACLLRRVLVRMLQDVVKAQDLGLRI